MDGAEHVGYTRVRPPEYDGDDKFSVFRGSGRRADCEACGAVNQHLISPDEFLGHAATEHGAAWMVQEYCERAADDVRWTGTPPIYRRGARHPRAKVMWI